MSCDEWQTPKDLFFALDREFGFDLDPCCTEETALCMIAYPRDRHMDGLTKGWSRRRVFVNPPYSRGNIEKWCEKCLKEAHKGALVVALLPCDCSTGWWQKYVMQAYEIRFLPHRVRFINPETGKPVGSPTFGSVIVVWAQGCGGSPPRVRMWDWKEVEE